MNDTLEKRKYKNILYRLKNISNKIDNFNSEFSSLKSSMDDYIIINDNTYNSDKLNDIRNSITSIKNELNRNIIPSINRKTY